MTHSLTDPPTGVGARRCHRIWKARKAKKREFETFGAKWRLLPLHCNNGATMGVLVCIQKWKAFFNAQWRGGKKLSHTHRSVPMSLGRPFFWVFLECCGIVFASIFIFLGSCCCFKQPAWEGKAFVRERLSHSNDAHDEQTWKAQKVRKPGKTDRPIDLCTHPSMVSRLKAAILNFRVWSYANLWYCWKSIWGRNILIRVCLICLLNVETWHANLYEWFSWPTCVSQK